MREKTGFVKKLLAFFLVICMTCGLGLSNFGRTEQVEAALGQDDGYTDATGMTRAERFTHLQTQTDDLSSLTFNTFGISDGTYTTTVNSNNTGVTGYWGADGIAYNNSVFSGDFMFAADSGSTGTTAQTTLTFGAYAADRATGVRMWLANDGSSMSIQYITPVWDSVNGHVTQGAKTEALAILPKDSNMKSFRGETFNLTLTFRQTDSDGDTIADDLVVFVYINHRLTKLYYYETDANGNPISLQLVEANALVVADAYTNAYNGKALYNRFDIATVRDGVTLKSCEPKDYYTEVFTDDLTLQNSATTYYTQTAGRAPTAYMTGTPSVDHMKLSGTMKITTDANGNTHGGFSYGARWGSTLGIHGMDFYVRDTQTINGVTQYAFTLDVTGVHGGGTGLRFLANRNNDQKHEYGFAEADFANGVDFSIAVEGWDYDGDGAKDDGKISIYFRTADGEMNLFYGVYMIVHGMLNTIGDTVGTKLFFTPFGGTVVDSTSTSEILITTSDNFYPIPTHYRKTSLADFGIMDGTYSAGETIIGFNSELEKLGNTFCSFKVNSADTSFGGEFDVGHPDQAPFAIYYGLTSDYATAGNGMTIFPHWTTRYTIASEAVYGGSGWGNRFVWAELDGLLSNPNTLGRDLTITVALTVSDLQRDNKNNDGHFDCWINGVHVARIAIISDWYNKVGNGIGFQVNQGTLTITSTEMSGVSFTNNELDLTDFNVPVGEYGYNNNNFSSEFIDNADYGRYYGYLDGKMFTTYVRFNSYDSTFYYGCSEYNRWLCLRLGTTRSEYVAGDPATNPAANANIYARKFYANDSFQKVRLAEPTTPGSTGAVKEIYAGDADVQLAENTYLVSFTTRNVDADGDDIWDDLEVGIWFNGKLYQNSYMYGIDCADLYEPRIRVYCQSERGNVVLGDYTQGAPTEEIYCSDNYAYCVDGDVVEVTADKTTGIAVADGVVNGDFWNTDKPGAYTIAYQDSPSSFQDKVLVYKTFDVTTDGKAYVKDLVALKNLAAGKRSGTHRPGLYAVGYGTDSETSEAEAYFGQEFVQSTAVGNIHDFLLLPTNKVGAKKLSQSIVGQTGSDTYINGVISTRNGISLVHISDVEAPMEETKAELEAEVWEDSGLDYVIDYDYPESRELKVLQLTDINGALTDTEKAQIESENPDFIIVTGNSVRGNGDLASEQADMAQLVADLDSYKIPWAPMFGTQDQKVLTAEMLNAYFTNGSTALGITGSKYCVYTRRADIGGDGNYSVGLSKNGVLQRVFYMLDSNGCMEMNATDKELYRTGKAIGSGNYQLYAEQLKWYRGVASQVEEFANKEVPSCVCMSAPATEVTRVVLDKYQTAWDTYRTASDYTIDYMTYKFQLPELMSGSGDFGTKVDRIAGLDDYIYPYLNTVGTDGVFFGGMFPNTLSVVFKDIRWTYGSQDGITAITIANDGTFSVAHK